LIFLIRSLSSTELVADKMRKYIWLSISDCTETGSQFTYRRLQSNIFFTYQSWYFQYFHI